MRPTLAGMILVVAWTAFWWIWRETAVRLAAIGREERGDCTKRLRDASCESALRLNIRTLWEEAKPRFVSLPSTLTSLGNGSLFRPVYAAQVLTP